MKKNLSNIFVVSLALCILAGCAGKSGKTDEGSVSMPVSGPLESNMPDPSFSSGEYKKLLALRFEGYEDMSVSEYQKKAWELLDEPEYFYLMERFAASEPLYECRDSDETAYFLFYILEPITAEKWQTREFGGYAVAEHPDRADYATFEYNFSLTILDKDKLTVGEYNAARIGITNSLQDMLQDKTEEQLQDGAFMKAEIGTKINHLGEQWNSEKLKIAVEYVYKPLSPPEPDDHAQNALQEQERRKYPNGTQEDYKSLLALQTPGYEKLSLADFNREVLKWADEDYERMERINCDVSYDDFSVPLTADERRFVSLSVNFSGMENAKHIQSNYTGRAEEAPSYGCHLPQKIAEKNGRSAWCDLYYQFSYQIADKETITVGERDRCIGGMMADIQEFWEESDIDSLLEMEKEEVVKELQKIADSYSTEKLTVTIKQNHVSFECMDERNIDSSAAYEKLAAYKTGNYLQQSIADFNAALASTPDELTEFLAAQADVVRTISPDDENYGFFATTMELSANELYCEHMGEEFTFYVYISKKSRPYKELDEDGEVIYDFCCFVDLQVTYSIDNPEFLTVAERDNTFLTFEEEMQKYLNSLSEAEITDGNMKTVLTDKAAELAKSLSTENIKLPSFEITSIEINGTA